MSWAETFGLAGVDISDPWIADFARGSLIQWGVGQGMSNNGVQRLLQQNRLGISVGQLDPMVRAERARQAADVSARQLGVDFSTGQLLPSVPPPDWTGQYSHRVTVTYRTRNEEGRYELSDRHITIVAGTPLTPMAASNAALDIMDEEPSDAESPGLPSGASVLATQLTGVWYRTMASRARP